MIGIIYIKEQQIYMKISSSKQIIQTLLLCLSLAFFGVFYWETIMSLPLFGDATIHGANALDVLNGGWSVLSSDYPSFYSYLMAILYSVINEKGFNLVPYLGFLFLLLSSFLLIRQMTKNYYLGLLAIILVGASPKIIYYSARMYQEILLSGLIIFCIYLFFKYLENKGRNTLFLLSLFVGVTLSTKQQGLFILYPSIVLFFIFIFLRKRISIIDLSMIIAIPFLIGITFYGVLFHTIGIITPGSGEFGVVNLVNTVGQKIFFYNEKHNTSLYGMNLNNHDLASTANSSDPLEIKLQQIEDKYNKVAFTRGESRHIWPTDVFTNFDKFNQANSLYVDVQGIKLENPYLLYLSFFSIIAGFIYCIYKYKRYCDLLLFTIIFLPINYILFIRNSDQQRYQLFIPIFVLIYICIFFKFLWKRIYINRYLNILSIILAIILLFIPLLSYRILANTRWGGSQMYSPSVGGITSVREVGNWFKDNTSQNILIGQECGNELHYYSQRNVSGDWRIYFLNSNDLRTYLTRTNISYYVIYVSQLTDDNDWKATCWVPKSFYKRMDSNFSKAYITKDKDIIIYKIQQTTI